MRRAHMAGYSTGLVDATPLYFAALVFKLRQ